MFASTAFGVDLCAIYSPVGGGHRAAAEALVQAAQAKGLSTALLNAFDYVPKVFEQLYVGTHLTGQAHMPNFYGRAFQAANRRDGLLEPIRRSWDDSAFAGLTRAVKALAPRAVLATHHLPLIACASARRTGKLQGTLGAVVTDYGTHAVWAEPGTDFFAVAGDWAREELYAHGTAGEVITSGIPVRSEYEHIAPYTHIAGMPLRVLISSGGAAVGPLLATLASFAGVPNVELTVLCGRDAQLRRRGTELARELGLHAQLVGYDNQMWKQVERAHVVVGKAGGLTVSETLTAGRPLVLTGAVPGNEKINEAFVLTQGAGIAAEPQLVGAAVYALALGGKLPLMAANAKRAVHHQAAACIVEHALRGRSVPLQAAA
jgi:processive 1,2-diacylglycerol beta-glucosyltransferase